MNNNPVVHFEIYVEDMDRARVFYEAVLEIKLEHMPPPTQEMGDMDMFFFPMAAQAPMDKYGAGGMLVKMEGFSAGGSGTVVYFGCDDCAVRAARAEAHGGSIFQAKTAIGEHGYCALVRDTEGNLIGFHSMQ